MHEIFVGALIGIFFKCIFLIISYHRDLRYDFKGWVNRQGRGLIWSFLPFAVFTAIIGYHQENYGENRCPCRQGMSWSSSASLACFCCLKMR
jgi:hypothetical protein